MNRIIYLIFFIYSSLQYSYAENENMNKYDSSFTDKKISVNFKNANIHQVMDVISQSSDINFIFDSDVSDSLKTSIQAKNASLIDTLEFILQTSKLRYKQINNKTFLIYNDTPDKIQQYDELIIKSFVLKSGDARKTTEVIKTMLNPKFIFLDEKNRLITIRDRKDIITSAEKIIQTYDYPDPEVILEVKVFELTNESLTNIGINLPNQVALSPLNSVGKSADLIVTDLLNLSRQSIGVGGLSPLVTLNLQDNKGNVNLLARPSLRVKSSEKAKIVVGDKVPVITSTVNQVSSSVTESVSYLDVGLNLEVTPEVQIDDQVNIKVSLEVSNIVKEIRTNNGLLTYQIGTRNANTSLQLKDGETQVLAGLIREEKRITDINIPLLGRLPLLGYFFKSQARNKNKSEIILSITPKIIRRNTERLNSIDGFASGTQNYLTLKSPIPFDATFTAKLEKVDSNSNFSSTDNSFTPDLTPQNNNLENNLNKILLKVPEVVNYGELLLLEIDADKLQDKSKFNVRFDRNIFTLKDIRLMTTPEQQLNYNTTLEGVEFSLNSSLSKQPLAIISLQPASDFKGFTSIIIDGSYGFGNNFNEIKSVQIK